MLDGLRCSMVCDRYETKIYNERKENSLWAEKPVKIHCYKSAFAYSMLLPVLLVISAIHKSIDFGWEYLTHGPHKSQFLQYSEA